LPLLGIVDTDAIAILPNVLIDEEICPTAHASKEKELNERRNEWRRGVAVHDLSKSKLMHASN
jgi:hypothetical protein